MSLRAPKERGNLEVMEFILSDKAEIASSLSLLAKTNKRTTAE